MDIDRLRSFVKGFSFDKCYNGGHGFSRILIQLFGFSGHGKSSFINTCMYVWEDEEYKNYAASSDDQGGSTTRRNTYPLNQQITLVDNRGFSTMDGYETGEIFAQIGNLLPLDGDVKWTKQYELLERMAQAEKITKTSDFIIPVFVCSVKQNIVPEELGEIKATMTLVKDLTGITPFVVLTFKTSGKLTERTNEFRNMGIERIFSFENYTKEDHFKTRGKHEELLRFLNEIIKEVQFQVDRPRDPEREMRKRRRFVTTYVKEREKILQKWERGKQQNNEQMRAGGNQEQPQKITEHRKQRKRRSEENTEQIYVSMKALSLEETPKQYGWDMRSPRPPRNSDDYREYRVDEQRHDEHRTYTHDAHREHRVDEPREYRDLEHREYRVGEPTENRDGEHRQYRVGEPRQYRVEEHREYRDGEPRQYRVEEHREYRDGEPRQYRVEEHREYRNSEPRQYRVEENKEYRVGEPRQYKYEEHREYRVCEPRQYKYEEHREYRVCEPRQYRVEEHREYRAGGLREHRYNEHGALWSRDDCREYGHGEFGEFNEQREQKHTKEKNRRYNVTSEVPPNIYEGID